MAKSRHIEFNIGEEIFGFKNEEIKDEKTIPERKHKFEMDKCECDSASSTMKIVGDRGYTVTSHIMDTLLKLSFIKILLFDIGISLGDSVTDFLQAFSLIFDETDDNFQITTFKYGVYLLLASMLPTIIAMIHIGLSKDVGIINKVDSIWSWILMIIGGIFFPFVPTFFYLLLIICPKDTFEEREKYKKNERRAHEIKSISGGLEAPIQMIIIFYLILRGFLPLPWLEPSSSSCLEDDFGRVACLPSIPMASVIFGYLSLVKSIFDLNIYPLVHEYDPSWHRLKKTLDLSLTFMPFFLANALFRISVFSLMFVFLDYWAVIPMILLWVLNLVIFGISKRSSSSKVIPVTAPNFDMKTFTVDNETIFNEEKNKPPLYMLNPGMGSTGKGTPEQLIHSQSQSVQSVTDTAMDDQIEENTSIFLNATMGVFFPSSHIHLPPIRDNSLELQKQSAIDTRIERISTWQRKFYQTQVYIISTILMIILGIVFGLVTVSKTFNYNSNILDPFWFNIFILLSMISGIISVLFAWELNSKRAKQVCSQAEDCHPLDPISAGNLLVKCLATTVWFWSIFIPFFIALAVFLQTKKDEPYVFLMTQEGHEVDLSILAALTSVSRMEMNPGTIYGQIENDCYVREDSNFTGKIIVINASSPKCKVFMEEEGLFEKVEESNASAIILLDDTPKSKWRVSSPFQIKPFHYKYVESTIIQMVLNSSKTNKNHLPFLMIRKDDWVKHELFFRKSGKGIFISWNTVKGVDLGKEFSCSKSTVIQIQDQDDDDKEDPDTCNHGKFLQGNGLISERFCIISSCSKFGGKCPRSFEFPERKFSLSVQCSIPNETSLTIQAPGKALTPVKLWAEPLSMDSDYCCHNTNSSESSYLEVLGDGCFDKWRDVGRYHKSCHFTSWTKGVCEKEMVRVYRLCLVTDMACVIREYFLEMCTRDIRLPLCSNSKNSC